MTAFVSPAVAAGWVLVALFAALTVIVLIAAVAAIVGLVTAVREDPTDHGLDDTDD